jgi:putative membrane protein insertion efficiency factor
MIKALFLKIIYFYQKNISPFLTNSCRFYPSCSEYWILAIKKHGVAKGVFLGIKRILRCHRFNPGGVDLP